MGTHLPALQPLGKHANLPRHSVHLKKETTKEARRVTQALDADVCRLHARPVEDRYCYLLLDGITLQVKTPTGCRTRVVLCAYGVTPQGQRELLSFHQVAAESEAAWAAFLNDLYQRGVVGRALRRGSVSPAGPRGACRVLRLPAGPLAADPDDECRGAGVPRGSPPDAPDELLQERSEL